LQEIILVDVVTVCCIIDFRGKDYFTSRFVNKYNYQMS